MEQSRFGDSDLTCSALGFGTWELSTTEYGAIDVAEAQRAAQEAIDHGITLFDTAESYGPYISEELLGKALGARRKEIVLVTKVGFKYEPRMKQCSSFDHVVTCAEGCHAAPRYRLGRSAADPLARPRHALWGADRGAGETEEGWQDPPLRGVQLLAGDDGRDRGDFPDDGKLSRRLRIRCPSVG